MINEVLSACSLGEVKNAINTTIVKLKQQGASENQIAALMDGTLKELRALNESKLPYDQYANLISAKVYIRELELQLFNVIN
jgi:hypothetical protein